MPVDVYVLGHAKYVIHTPDDQVFIYDTGVHSRALLSPAHALYPFVSRFLGLPLRGIITSHYHRDHIGTLPWLLRRYRAGLTHYSSKVYADTDELPLQAAHMEAFFSAEADTPAIPHVQVRYGDEIAGWFRVLSPTQAAVDANIAADVLRVDDGKVLTANPNDEHGCMVRLAHGAFSFLLTGDIGPSSAHGDDAYAGFQNALDEGTYPVSSTILQAPHHGDGGYITEELLQAIGPEFVVFDRDPTDAAAVSLISMLDNLDIPYASAWDTRLRFRGNDDGSWSMSSDVADVPRSVPWARAGGE